MRPQALHPRQLVAELVGTDRIAVGQIDGGHPYPPHAGLEVAGLLVGKIARQAGGDILDRLQAQDSDTVVALLAKRRDIVTEITHGLGREGRVLALDLLQQHDIGLGPAQPIQHVGQARVDRVDVPGGDGRHGCALPRPRPVRQAWR